MAPMAPRRPCSRSGCPKLVERKERFCSDHKQQYDRQRWKELDKQRGNTKERGYGRNHRKLRKLVMAEQPLCVMCEAEGILKPGEEMDHIDGNSRNLERSNLQMLCSKHHKQKTIAEDGGFGRPKKGNKH